jgi:hypothetical protein
MAFKFIETDNNKDQGLVTWLFNCLGVLPAMAKAIITIIAITIRTIMNIRQRSV